jgi:hypothetical protein
MGVKRQQCIALRLLMSVCSAQLHQRWLRVHPTNNTCSIVQLCPVWGALNAAAAAAAGAPDAPAPAVRLPFACLPAVLMAVRGWGGSAGAGTVALRPDVLCWPDHVMPAPQDAWFPSLHIIAIMHGGRVSSSEALRQGCHRCCRGSGRSCHTGFAVRFGCSACVTALAMCGQQQALDTLPMPCCGPVAVA